MPGDAAPQPGSGRRREPAFDLRTAALFRAAFALPPAQRRRLLERSCDGDAPLRQAVEALLAHHDQPDSLLGRLSADGVEPVPSAEIGYTLLERVGRGGTSVVYRARQHQPQRVVALKLISPEVLDADQVARFEREVEVLGFLRHPGICQLFDAGTADFGLGIGPVPFFAMEFVDGEPITAFARGRALSVEQRCGLLIQVLEAVHHAHERDVVHRDLKPQNLLVEVLPGEREPRAKVLDFGIARTMSEGAAAVRTGTGMILGTLAYMSPEQLIGGVADPRIDIYAIGVLAYELLTGRPPFALAGRSLPQILRIVEAREPVPPGRLDRRLRGDLEVIVQKAMAKAPGDRYASAAAMAEDLRRHLRAEPIAARPPTALYRLHRLIRRNRGAAAGVVVSFAVLLLSLVAVGLFAGREAEARALAEQTGARLRETLYRTELLLAGEAWHDPGGIPRVRAVLEHWLPAGDGNGDGGAGDLRGAVARGFEWHLLWGACNRAQRVAECVSTPMGLWWTADGARVIVEHWDGAAFHSAADGALLQQVHSAATPVSHAAPTATGEVLAITEPASVVRLVDVASGATLAMFEHDAPVRHCVLSADGRLLATIVERLGAAVWDTQSGRRLAFVEHEHVHAIALSADGGLFAVSIPRALKDGIGVRVWRVGDWAEPWRVLASEGLEHHAHLCFSRSGDRLASCGNEGWLRVWDVASAEQVFAHRHADSLRCAAFAPDGGRLAVACRDYCAHVHDLSAGTAQVLRGHDGIVGGVAWSPDGARLVTSGDDGTLRFWSAGADDVVRRVAPSTSRVMDHSQLAWSQAGRRLSLRASGLQQAWDFTADGAADGAAVGGTTLFTIDVAGGGQLSVDGERIVVRRPARAEVAHVLRELRAIAPSPAGDRIGLCARDRFELWDPHADALVVGLDIQADLRGLSWDHTGTRLLLLATDDVLQIDGRTGERLAAQPFPMGALAIACSPVDDTVAVACVDQRVRLWSPSRPGMTELPGHTGHVLAVAWSPDGRRLASGSRDASVRLWDPAARAQVLVLRCAGHVDSVAWRGDGRALAAVDIHGEVTVWDASAGYGSVR